MIADPPVLPDAVKLTVACALPAVAVPIVGAVGTVAGVTLFDAVDGTLLPIALVAMTVQEIGVPFTRPLTVIGDVNPVLLCAPQVAV